MCLYFDAVLNLAFALSLLCFVVMHASLLLSNTTSIEVMKIEVVTCSFFISLIVLLQLDYQFPFPLARAGDCCLNPTYSSIIHYSVSFFPQVQAGCYFGGNRIAGLLVTIHKDKNHSYKTFFQLCNLTIVASNLIKPLS